MIIEKIKSLYNRFVCSISGHKPNICQLYLTPEQQNKVTEIIRRRFREGNFLKGYCVRCNIDMCYSYTVLFGERPLARTIKEAIKLYGNRVFIKDIDIQKPKNKITKRKK